MQPIELPSIKVTSKRGVHGIFAIWRVVGCLVLLVCARGRCRRYGWADVDGNTRILRVSFRF